MEGEVVCAAVDVENAEVDHGLMERGYIAIEQSLRTNPAGDRSICDDGPAGDGALRKYQPVEHVDRLGEHAFYTRTGAQSHGVRGLDVQRNSHREGECLGCGRGHLRRRGRRRKRKNSNRFELHGRVPGGLGCE